MALDGWLSQNTQYGPGKCFFSNLNCRAWCYLACGHNSSLFILTGNLLSVISHLGLGLGLITFNINIQCRQNYRGGG